jgi:hypothetical protein
VPGRHGPFGHVYVEWTRLLLQLSSWDREGIKTYSPQALLSSEHSTDLQILLRSYGQAVQSRY